MDRLVDAAGNPLMQKRIAFILKDRDFCTEGCCEGFKMLQKANAAASDRVPHPMTILCPTCRFFVRDNHVPDIFAKQTGVIDPNIKPDNADADNK